MPSILPSVDARVANWHLNGWHVLVALVIANAIGVFFHV